MTSELATLRLEPETYTHSVVDGRARRHPQSHFLTFLIDGVSLLRLSASEGSLVTELNRARWSDVLPAVETLLGRRPASYLDAGRIPLLVCPSCGELECGAITAVLHMESTTVTWSDLRWEYGNAYGPKPVDELTGPLRFDRAQYEAALVDAAERVADLPEDEPLFITRPPRERHLPWPWKRDS